MGTVASNPRRNDTYARFGQPPLHRDLVVILDPITFECSILRQAKIQEYRLLDPGLRYPRSSAFARWHGHAQLSAIEGGQGPLDGGDVGSAGEQRAVEEGLLDQSLKLGGLGT